MRTLARLLQFIGLILLPLALVLSLIPAGAGDKKVLTTGQELMALAFGAAAFWIGRLLEGYAKR
jgi:hypothetical protein